MRDAFALFATATIVVVFVSLLDCAAHGQEQTSPIPAAECDSDTITDMVRLRYAELGARTDRQRTREADALWWVLVRRRAVARRIHDPDTTYRQVLHWYAGGRLRSPPHDRAREIATLDPGSLPSIKRRAEQWCDGYVPDPCRGRCIHWGASEAGTIDMRRASRAGWSRAGFGRHLAFWTR